MSFPSTPATDSSNGIESPNSLDVDDSATVCYCYSLTRKDVLEGVKSCGNLKNYQKKTKAGMACGGCQIFLSALTGEETADITQQHQVYDSTKVCVAPGTRIMAGFLISCGSLHSKVFASNAVAPQFADCDMSGVFDYVVMNSRGEAVLHRKLELSTNDMLAFDTRNENFPDPFCGMFLFGLPRHNFGAARFNVHWCNGISTTSTHENSTSGRPRVFLPVVYSREMLESENDIYFGQINPHGKPVDFTITAFDTITGESMQWRAGYPPYGSGWMCATEAFFRPALNTFRGNSVAIRIASIGLDPHAAITTYYFFHNRKTGSWSAQHL